MRNNLKILEIGKPIEETMLLQQEEIRLVIR